MFSPISTGLSQHAVLFWNEIHQLPNISVLAIFFVFRFASMVIDEVCIPLFSSRYNSLLSKDKVLDAIMIVITYEITASGAYYCCASPKPSGSNLKFAVVNFYCDFMLLIFFPINTVISECGFNPNNAILGFAILKSLRLH
jgi:hypothetical protein